MPFFQFRSAGGTTLNEGSRNANCCSLVGYARNRFDRLLLPLSVLVGGGFLVLADVIARTALSPAEIPIGVVTAFFGAPFFAVVLRTSRRMAA